MADTLPTSSSSDQLSDDHQFNVTDKAAAPEAWQQEHTVSSAALKEFCSDYAKYLEFPDLTKKQFQNLEETVESMLARIDEFGAFVDTITADTAKSSRSFALLQEKCTQISQLFPVIDTIQGMVDKVKTTVDTLEERTAYAEKQMGTLNFGLDTNAFKWLANKMNTSSQPLQLDQNWTPVNIITAEEFVNNIRAANSNDNNNATTTTTTNAL